MRIQHNIMAMSAYRNYTNNVSAMQKNLEKLSSGYKINRAGDDAAGLAISEKMRAQITGLETAQKNAKDGISLVQTAEGALTEVHDMLNRMVELATQSANGTYDNDTDREQLQKEMDQLKAEIDRIADSSNFNGIKLLDGSMDAGGGTKQVAITLPADSATQFGEIGDKTILKGAGSAAKGTVFGVQFDNLAVDAKAGDKLTVQVGTDKIDITLANAQKYDASALADELVKACTNNGQAEVSIGGQTFTVAKGDDGTSVTFTQKAAPTSASEVVEASMDVKMTYTPTGGTAQVLDGGDIFVGYADEDEGAGEDEITITGPTSKMVAFTNGNGTEGSEANATAEFNLAGFSVDGPGTVTFTVGGKTYDVDITADDIANEDSSLDEIVAGKLVDKLNANKITDEDAGTFSAAQDEDTPTKITLTSANQAPMADSEALKADISVAVKQTSGGNEPIEGGGSGGETKTETIASEEISVSGVDLANKSTSIDQTALTALAAQGSPFANSAAKVKVNDDIEVSLAGLTSTWTAGDSKTSQDVADAMLTAAKNAVTAWNTDNADKGYTYGNVRISTTAAGEDGDIVAQAGNNGLYILMDKITPQNNTGAATGAGVSGSYNAATVKIDQGATVVADQRASTTINLSTIYGGDIGDGSTLTIGENTYTFKWGDSNSFSGTTITLDKNATAADRINYAAKAMSNMSNSAFSIGNETTGGKITIDEKAGNTKYTTELGTHDGFESLFSAKSVSAEDTTKGLKLQIGDTADSYNQLRVSIGDTHVASLGLDSISIKDQDSAAKAIDAIKTAINTVSDIRGTLGATQNRLDHTINNLSVMTENIQDAESTIRDVDVAEEMMAYTKNNILIQSAQAMLAQANQVPQGVLQLLQ